MEKIIAIHQPQYLPWLPFMDKADQSDVFIFLDNVQFQRRGVQNRNLIRGSAGPLMLTVPVIANRESLINEVRIADTVWPRKHIEAIRNNYSRCRGLPAFEDGLRPILERPWTFLVDLNLAVTQWLFAQLGIKCACLNASDLGCTGKRDDLIIELCASQGATTYLSGQGAKAYQDKAKFMAQGIGLRYQTYQTSPYPQEQGPEQFMADLSSLDLILNVGAEARHFLLSGRRESE